MKVTMRSSVLALTLVMCAAAAAVAQPAPDQDRLNAAGPPPLPPAGPPCVLAPPPPPASESGKPARPPYDSPYRQSCETELSKDSAWWFDLEARLRAQIHRQAAKEITTNNRHVVLAYGAMWLAAIGFVVVMWRRQQALKREIERLSRELKKAETS